MSGVSGAAFSGVSFSGAAATMPPAAAPDLSKGRKAAREFEAQLIESVLQSFEKTFATLPGQDASPGEDNYNYMGTQALAGAMATGRGFGIAAMISAHLPHEGE
jgi:Rod binding domain-containing protein